MPPGLDVVWTLVCVKQTTVGVRVGSQSTSDGEVRKREAEPSALISGTRMIGGGKKSTKNLELA